MMILLSRNADSIDCHDSLMPFVPINHCCWQVLSTELMNVCFYWSVNTSVSMYRRPSCLVLSILDVLSD